MFNVDNTNFFSCCYEIEDFFPVSLIQLMSRCAGAGRERRQAGSQAGQRTYSVPWMSCSFYEWGLAGQEETISVSLLCGFVSSLGREFGLFCGFYEVHNFMGSVIAVQGLTENPSLGDEKDCIMYSFFCVFIIIVIITVSSSSIHISVYFVVLLNCLYLNPWVSPFVRFSSPRRCGGRGGVSERLSSAELPAAG